MISLKKIAALALLLVLGITFSGCTFKKAEEADAPEAANVKKEEPKIIDTDGDGLTDSQEEKMQTHKNNSDSDSDGLNDYEEVEKWETDPSSPDTDGDGYPDGQEVSGGYNPRGSGQLDTDSDGLGNADEKRLGTDPNKFDTDRDGLNDKEEADRGTDPLKAE